MNLVMGSYRPDVVVVQCGADSLSKDKLGHFNMSIRGHAECLKHMMTFGIPMVCLGGGGYTIENVSRCWAYETGVILGTEIDNSIPSTDPFYSLYEQDSHKLHFEIEQGKENINSRESLEMIYSRVAEHMR